MIRGGAVLFGCRAGTSRWWWHLYCGCRTWEEGGVIFVIVAGGGGVAHLPGIVVAGGLTEEDVEEW